MVPWACKGMQRYLMEEDRKQGGQLAFQRKEGRKVWAPQLRLEQNVDKKVTDFATDFECCSFVSVLECYSFSKALKKTVSRWENMP